MSPKNCPVCKSALMPRGGFRRGEGRLSPMRLAIPKREVNASMLEGKRISFLKAEDVRSL